MAQAGSSTAPPLSPDQIELEPRPNTVELTQVEIPVISLSKEEFEGMSSEELCRWIGEKMGLDIDPTWPKSRIATWLQQNSLDCSPS